MHKKYALEVLGHDILNFFLNFQFLTVSNLFHAYFILYLIFSRLPIISEDLLPCFIKKC